MSFTENLDVYFLDFGFTAVVDGDFVRGIFDNAFAEHFGITAGTSPMLVCKAADVSDVAAGAAVHVNSSDYTVASLEPDGTGMMVLRLVEA